MNACAVPDGFAHFRLTPVSWHAELLSFELNSLTGTIPTEIGLMTGIEAMIFSWNQLTGTIPTELAFLKSVTEIALNDNLLEGTLPPELGNSLTSLSDFFVHNNPGITGQVPETYGNFTNISTF